jgi:hypothetical protein
VAFFAARKLGLLGYRRFPAELVSLTFFLLVSTFELFFAVIRAND